MISYASIREWLIADVATRKNRRQRLSRISLKIPKIKLSRISSNLILWENSSMGNEKRDRKTKVASNKVLLASVTTEMAKPRMTQSVQTKVDKQIKSMDANP